VRRYVPRDARSAVPIRLRGAVSPLLEDERCEIIGISVAYNRSLEA
jgi:hypothetical protein